MNYKFPEFIGSFGSSTPNMGAFTGNPISLSSGSGGGFKGGMDPFSAVLGLGSLGASIFGGMSQAQASADAMQAQFGMANAGIQAGERAAKAQTALNLAAGMSQAGQWGDIAFKRQLDAAKAKNTFLADMERAQLRQSALDERMARISPEAVKAANIENQLSIARAVAQQRAAIEGMYGPIKSSASFSSFA